MGARVLDLKHFEELGQFAQGASRAQSFRRIAAAGILGQLGSFVHDVNID